MEYKLPKLPLRAENSNKGTFGKVINFAGSKFMPGAAYLSSVSALRMGAGYVKLSSEESVLNTVTKLAPEIVLTTSNEISYDINTISFGCGCDINDKTKNLLLNIHKNRKNIPTIIDADGLNVLADISLSFDKNTIITPHPKEASRLLNSSIDDILDNLQLSAKQLSEKYNCITVLKTHNTIVTNGTNFYINKSGNSALAKAGSGDILCGMIAGLLAQGMTTYDASKLGVYLHGLAGEIASKELSEYCVLASDLLKYIPLAIKSYINQNS